MIFFKDKRDLFLSGFEICAVLGCEKEATKLFATETNLLDVCDIHQKELLEENK